MKFVFRAASIVGVLFGLAVFALLLAPTIGHHPNPREEITKRWIHENAKTALVRFRIDCRRFPTTSEGLNALIQPPAGLNGWKGPYLEGGRVPLDSWGRSYRYRSPAVKSSAPYDLWSDADDVLGDKDDIASWE